MHDPFSLQAKDGLLSLLTSTFSLILQGLDGMGGVARCPSSSRVHVIGDQSGCKADPEQEDEDDDMETDEEGSEYEGKSENGSESEGQEEEGGKRKGRKKRTTGKRQKRGGREHLGRRLGRGWRC